MFPQMTCGMKKSIIVTQHNHFTGILYEPIHNNNQNNYSSQ